MIFRAVRAVRASARTERYLTEMVTCVLRIRLLRMSRPLLLIHKAHPPEQAISPRSISCTKGPKLEGPVSSSHHFGVLASLTSVRLPFQLQARISRRPPNEMEIIDQSFR